MVINSKLIYVEDPPCYVPWLSIEVTSHISSSMSSSTYQTIRWSAVPFQEEDFRFKVEEGDEMLSILQGNYQDSEVVSGGNFLDNGDLDEYLVF